MPEPQERYPVNTIPGITWALKLYFKKKPLSKKSRTMEITFPAGKHKEKMRKKGEHKIVIWHNKMEVFVRSRCDFDSKCEFNSDRFDGSDRDALIGLGWEGTDSRQFFTSITKWLLRIGLDFVTLVRAIVTMCDRRVEIPLTTKYGRTFERFKDYQQNRWPEEATPDDPPKYLEEILVRMNFWLQSAAEVGALKYTPTKVNDEEAPTKEKKKKKKYKNW
ncbi:MAG: hypothetical protein ACTSQZ_05420 [Candidatus Thorarchaeota archaeon]